MQIVQADDLEKPLLDAVSRLKAFGDDYLYIERYFNDIDI